MLHSVLLQQPFGHAARRRAHRPAVLGQRCRGQPRGDERAGKSEGVYYVDRTTHAHREARAKVVVLAASALESTRILLNSRSSRFPSGLGNSSGQLGHYLMDHFTLEGAGGFMPQFKSSQREPRGTPCGFLIAKYVNTGKNVNKNFLRGYRFDGDGSQELYAHAFGLAGFGPDWRRQVRSEIPYYFGMTAQGECLPRYDNYVSLDPEKKDAWGIPALHVVASYGENEHAMAKAMRRDVLEILDAMKVEEPRAARRELERFRQEYSRVRHGAHGERPEEKRGQRLLPAPRREERFRDRRRGVCDPGLLRAHAYHHGDFRPRRRLYCRRVPQGESVMQWRLPLRSAESGLLLWTKKKTRSRRGSPAPRSHGASGC